MKWSVRGPCPKPRQQAAKASSLHSRGRPDTLQDGGVGGPRTDSVLSWESSGVATDGRKASS